MSRDIHISFDEDINGYIVRFPDLVELASLKSAKIELERMLEDYFNRGKFALLLDMGAHEFESIECLKYVRSFLSIKLLVENCRKYASVVPECYAEAGVKSETEASFNHYSKAYYWLCQN